MNEPTAARLPDDLARTVADPKSYAEWDSLHETLKLIRRDYPFARATIENYNPFWVASTYKDIQEVAKNNDVFLSGLGPLIDNDTVKAAKAAGQEATFRSIVAMNPPDHDKYRKLAQWWFQPKNLRPLENSIRGIARDYIDKLADLGGTCDFVKDIAYHYPLLVVMNALGVPAADEPRILKWTQQYFGNNDAELNRTSSSVSVQESAGSVADVIRETNAYFKVFSDARRREPTDDLISVIANSTIDGESISDVDAMGYYISAAFAGHDTTSSSVSGGMWALCENPDQFERVKADLSLIPSLVEESIRWTTPIHQFTRIAAADCVVHNQQVKKGDWVVLCFPSGNRDEAAFDKPFEFIIDRKPNRHIGFGYGPHICIGMHLARMEMRIFFEELIPRLKSVSLAGIPTRTITNFVGGPKSLPIRYELS